MESLKLNPRVKVFKEENDSNNLTLGPSLGDSITKVWPEIQRLSDIFAVTPAYRHSKMLTTQFCDTSKVSQKDLPRR